MERADKVKSSSVSLYPAQWDYLGSFPEGKSGRLQIIIDELINRPREIGETTSGNCLVELAERHVPFFADEMRQACEGIDQPKALAVLLINFAGGKSGVSKKFLQAVESMAD